MLFTVNDDFNFFLSVYLKTIEMTLYTTLSSHGLQVLRKQKKKPKTKNRHGLTVHTKSYTDLKIKTND